jgi:hypothetical protein
MSIIKQPSRAHTVLAKHDFKVVEVNGLKQPLLRWFTLAAWLAIPTLNMNGKRYEKQGFTKVDADKYFVPDEAKELMKNQQAEAKVSQVKVVVETEKSTSNDDITSALVNGDAARFSIAVLHKYVVDQAIDLPGFEKLPKGELINKLTDLV